MERASRIKKRADRNKKSGRNRIQQMQKAVSLLIVADTSILMCDHVFIIPMPSASSSSQTTCPFSWIYDSDQHPPASVLQTRNFDVCSALSLLWMFMFCMQQQFLVAVCVHCSDFFGAASQAVKCCFIVWLLCVYLIYSIVSFLD